jgi:hypothetical protein
VREWAEEHWAGVGVTVFIAGALALSVVLATAFNVIATRLERGDTVYGSPASATRTHASATASNPA